VTAKVIAHRGASDAAPENTVEAFRLARELGADWVELDVRQTVDGVLAVHHDSALPDGRAIAHTTAAELPPGVPTLRDALAACDGMGVNVEVKPHDSLHVVERVIDVARSWGGPVLVSSFQLALVQRSRQLAPDLPAALLTEAVADIDRLVELCVTNGFAAVNPWDATVDPELVERAHGAGIEVNVWTVDDPARMKELDGWGADGIVTNVPDVARRTLGR
jgi:glycerophosphoryl diester phosphodiesterase